MTSSTFPAHWRKAVESGDASGFTDREDLIAFFGATYAYSTFMALSEDQRMNVVDLRSACSDASLEAKMRGHARDHDKKREALKRKLPQIFSKTAAKPFGASPAKPVTAAAKRTQAEISAMWSEAADKVNAGLGFNRMAAGIYARRAGNK